MDKDNNQYIPGLRNIGPGNISAKKFMGWAGLGIALVYWLLLIVYDQVYPWGLLLFFPVFISALGFLQTIQHFSIVLAMKGMFNISSDTNRSITQAEFKKKDRRRASELIVYSFLIAAIAALMVFISGR